MKSIDVFVPALTQLVFAAAARLPGDALEANDSSRAQFRNRQASQIAWRQGAARSRMRKAFSRRFEPIFFLTETNGALKHAQTTATLGLVYQWGTKKR